MFWWRGSCSIMNLNVAPTGVPLLSCSKVFYIRALGAATEFLTSGQVSVQDIKGVTVFHLLSDPVFLTSLTVTQPLLFPSISSILLSWSIPMPNNNLQ